MRRPSPATLIASVALFVSLGGTSLAANRYLITSRSQIAPNVRQALRGDQGPRGLTGATGAQGPQGAQGSAGVNAAIDWTRVYLATDDQKLTTDAPNADAQAFCRPGDHALTGGFQGFAEVTTISELMPAAYSPDGVFHSFGTWVVGAHLDPNAKTDKNPNPSGLVRAWALCTSN